MSGPRRRWHKVGCLAATRIATVADVCTCPLPTYRVLRRLSNGTIRVAITCPRCGDETYGWLWSFMGSGKRCGGCGGLMRKSGLWMDDKASDSDQVGDGDRADAGKGGRS